MSQRVHLSGQFVDHDLTRDNTAAQLGQDVTVDELLQGRSPALDLDSLYGRGPHKDPQFYAGDGVQLKIGTTRQCPTARRIRQTGHQGSSRGLRLAAGRHRLDEGRHGCRTSPIAQRREPRGGADPPRLHPVPQPRGRASSPSRTHEQRLFAARDTVVRHYQWMLRTDYPPADRRPGNRRGRLHQRPQVLRGTGRPEQISTGTGGTTTDTSSPTTRPPCRSSSRSRRTVRAQHGPRRVPVQRGVRPAAPVYGHAAARLFAFTGMGGNFAPPKSADELNDPDVGGLHVAHQLDRGLPPPVRLHRSRARRPRGDPRRQRHRADRHPAGRPAGAAAAGAFGGRRAAVPRPDIERNLAFRNLTRADMVKLASGQQMAEYLGVRAPDRRADRHRRRGRRPSLSEAEQQGLVASNPAVVLHPARGGAQRRSAGRRRRPDRRRGVPSRDGRQQRTRSCATRTGGRSSDRTTIHSGWSTCCCSRSRASGIELAPLGSVLTCFSASTSGNHQRVRSGLPARLDTDIQAALTVGFLQSVPVRIQ